MNNTIILLIDTFIMLFAGAVGVVLVFLEDEPEKLIILYNNKIKRFTSINQIKKDVGAQAFETVIQFESKPEKIVKSLYPNCKIIKNTLL